MPKRLNIQCLMTGNEVMSGDTIDTNSAHIAQVLGANGLTIARRVTVNDDINQLLSELSDMVRTADIVIMNGGLGPTIDDLTAEVLALLADEPLVIHPDAEAQLLAWCERRGQLPNEANLKQRLLPRSAEIIPNARGSAPGIDITVGDTRLFATPGVPSEMRDMMPLIIERIESQWGARAHANVMRLHTFGLGESNAQQLINSSGFDWPESVELGFRASAPTMEIKLTVADTKDLPAQQACADHIAALFGDHILGTGETSIGQSMVELLSERGLTLTTAESCTGGLIASLITQIPGSSKAFHAGFVTYDDAIKSSVLGVRQSDLDQYGAVSKAVVEQMALGALRASNADYAIAVSGIAGPDGGSIDKPLGRVWIAYGSSSDLRTIELTWPLPRILFQTMVAAAALDLLRRHILELPPHCLYIQQRQNQPQKIDS